MKLNHILILFCTLFFVFGCGQPIAVSLLTSETSNDNSDSTSTDDDNGIIDILPDNQVMTLNIDNGDKIEITGTCKDADRRKNQIIVEVFAGEDETANPYISNSISDKCITTDAGLPTTDKCFWSTKGSGMVEDAGLPTERTFPQCHNGRFGFSVKLGKILVNPAVGQPNLKYTIRFKLRTLDGLLTDSAFNKVNVIRGLDVPTFIPPVYSEDLFRCRLEARPARFNFNILYTLTRTVTDAVSTNAIPETLYSNQSTAAITDGSSVFSWNDISSIGTHFLIPGVTYNYTLTSRENQFNYAATPPTPTMPSAVATCPTSRIVISTTPPNPTAGTCYMVMFSSAHPFWPGGGVSYQWAYSTTPNWIGANADAQVGFTFATCGDTVACTQAGFPAKTKVFFSVRALAADGQVGKWANLVSCTTP